MTDEELDALVHDIDHHSDNISVDEPIIDRILAAITTLRAQLAEARFERDAVIAVREMLGNRWANEKARADRAEAALAAPEVMHEDAPAAIIGGIGNQIHNLGCELQNDEDISLRLSDLACRIWDAAKLFPTEPTALDRMLAEARDQTALGMVYVMATAAKEAREKALREAAQVLTDEIDLARIAMPQVVPILAADRKAILALIEKTQCV